MSGLVLNALVSGVLLGGFYAAVTIGLTLVFGYLNIVNIAHPAFIVLGAYIAFACNGAWGLDPVAAGFLMMPAFFVVGVLVYSVYNWSFERRDDESLRGLAFFFGLMFIVEVALILQFGVDYRLVNASYIGATLDIGPLVLPLRMLIPFLVSMALAAAIYAFLSRSFAGRAIRAVAQDPLALRLVAADPVRIRRLAFGIGIASAGLAGALLIVIGPVEPAIGRLYIGRVFAIVVLGGMGSLGGTVAAALLLGVVESLTASLSGPSWAPAVAFGFLLFTLAVRPSGLFGR